MNNINENESSKKEIMMFREMRRFKQQISEEECIRILKEQPRGAFHDRKECFPKSELSGTDSGAYDRKASKKTSALFNVCENDETSKTIL